MSLTQAQHQLPLDIVQVALGDLLDRETLMHGSYDFERGVYRHHLLRERIRYYRKWKKKNIKRKSKKDPRGPIEPGHKRAIRAYMHIIDTAYECRVSGIEFLTSQNEGGIANQCYIGRGGMGSSVQCKVIFMGLLEDQYHGTGNINHVAINVTAQMWPQHRILAAKKKLAERQAEQATRLCI